MAAVPIFYRIKHISIKRLKSIMKLVIPINHTQINYQMERLKPEYQIKAPIFQLMKKLKELKMVLL